MADYLSGFPTITVEIAFGTAPSTTPTWTDVTSYARAFSTRRGRSHELDRIEAGTLRLRLNNRDRRFDPSNTSSPYSPNILPMRRVRVSSVALGTQTTFGSSTSGTGFDLIAANYIQLSSYTVATDAYITKLSLYADGNGSAGASQTIKGLIYSDASGSPGTLQATSSEATIANGQAAGWVDLTFVTPILLSAGTYWLGFHGGDTNLGARFGYNLVSNQRKYVFDLYSDGPRTTFGTPDGTDSEQIAIKATYQPSTSQRIFTGYIQDWPMSWKGVKDAEVSLSATDGFAVLATQNLIGVSWPQELSGARVARVLDAVGWPAGERTLDAGQSLVAAVDTTASTTAINALQHIQDVANSERGNFFIDGQGYAVFQDRHRRLKSPYLTSQATFGDNGTTELPYVDLGLSYEVDEVRNDIQVKSASGTLYENSDATSIINYLQRSYNLDTQLADENDAAALSEYLLSRYKDPYLRITTIELNPRMSSSVSTQALTRELSDRITVTRRPPGGGSAITKDAHIEFVSHDVQKNGNSWKWRTQWSLSPTETNTFWIMGDSTYSVLGTSTRLAY